MVTRIKTSALRAELKAVLAAVEAGQEIIIEHYQRPIARLIPYTEDTMTLTDLARDIADVHDQPYERVLGTIEVLAIQAARADGQEVRAVTEVDAEAARVLRDAYADMVALTAEME